MAAQDDFMEAAGIEPARHSPPIALRPRYDRHRYEHWKLDGEAGDGAGNSEPGLTDCVRTAAPPSNFSAKTTICGIDFEVRRDDRHLNLHLYEEGEIWRFEELEQAIPKLEAILAAAKMAANLEVLDDTG